MQLSRKQKLLGGLTLTLGILLFERYYLSNVFPTISNIIKIDPDLIVVKYAIPLPKFGLLPVMVIVFGMLAVMLIPYKHLFSGSAWKSASAKWTRTFLLSLLVPLGFVLGAFLYYVIKGIFPDWVKAIAESFGIAFTPTILNTPWQKVDGSLASILGLLVGVYLVYRYWKKNP